MVWLKKVKELEILDERVVKAQRFNDEIILENKKLNQLLIDERNSLRNEKVELEHERIAFESKKETIRRIAEHRYEHLEAELDFIKEHRMLPTKCKFFTKKPKLESPKKLKKIK